MPDHEWAIVEIHGVGTEMGRVVREGTGPKGA